jgi:hypothetical protein
MIGQDFHGHGQVGLEPDGLLPLYRVNRGTKIRQGSRSRDDIHRGRSGRDGESQRLALNLGFALDRQAHGLIFMHMENRRPAFDAADRSPV